MPTGNGQNLEETYYQVLVEIHNLLNDVKRARSLTPAENTIHIATQSVTEPGDWRERLKFGAI